MLIECSLDVHGPITVEDLSRRLYQGHADGHWIGACQIAGWLNRRLSDGVRYSSRDINDVLVRCDGTWGSSGLRCPGSRGFVEFTEKRQ